MATESADIHSLFERMLRGDAGAAEQLLADHGAYLRRVVRQHLPHRLRSKFDSLDFVQDVWLRVVERRERFRDTGEPADVLAYLARAAQNRVAEVARQRLATEKYDAARERALDPAGDESGLPATRHATPSLIAVGAETWALLTRDLPPVHERILDLLRLGATHDVVAQELGVSTKTVQRVLKRAQDRLRQTQAREGE